MHSVLNKNPSLNCLKLIRYIHCQMNEVILQNELTPLDIKNMKFAPITSVKSSASLVGTILCYDRTVDNLTLKI
jgi:hypothetical protein